MQLVDLLVNLSQQYALYLLIMVIVQITLGTAVHWATREQGWDDTWIGAIGLSIVFGAPLVALWLAGLNARVLVAMLLQAVVIVGLVKFTEWARRASIVDIALFVLQTLACLLPPGLLVVWLSLAPPSLTELLESFLFVTVSVVAVGLTAMGWDWHHHVICGYSRKKPPLDHWPAWQQEMLDDIQYALDRQMRLIHDIVGSNIAMDRLVTGLRQQQESIEIAIDQLDKYRRIGMQTIRDIQDGKATCYLAREKQVEEETETNRPMQSLKVVGR